jgi:predicted AAA+ superfamily ATPase
MNPWWENEKWCEQDPDYSERVRKSPFAHRWLWILDKAVKQLVRGEGTYDILVIAGPRRTGKTSVMKKLIEQNYRNIRNNSIYLRLDDYLLRKAVEGVGLKEILSNTIENAKLDEPLIVIIDEASAIDNWDLHIKNVIDSFTSEGKKFLLLVTGSLGLRLIRGSTNILARRGDIPYLSAIANPGVILPYKFSEYADALGLVRQYVRFFNLLKRAEREKILLDLAKPNVLNSNIQRLRILYDRVSVPLQALFDSYLVSGGYPLILYELIIKGRFKQLDRKWYGEFMGSLLQDLKYTNLREDVTRSVLEYFSEINKLSPLVDLNKLESHIRAKVNLSRRDLEKFKIEDYIGYFNEIFIMVKATEIAQITETTDIAREIKLFIIDPFIIHTIMFKDYSDPLIESRKLLKDPSQMGILVEHTVCSHFLRLTTRPTLYYHVHKQQNRTAGEIDCICHYRHTYIPIEVKYTENEEMLRREAGITSNILNDLNIKSRPIIVSKNMLEIQPNYAIIPANTFLLLF